MTTSKMIYQNFEKSSKICVFSFLKFCCFLLLVFTTTTTKHHQHLNNNHKLETFKIFSKNIYRYYTKSYVHLTSR